MSEFRTRNLALAAFLSHIGLQHLRTEKVGDKSVAFIFADSLNECSKIERDFYSGAGCEDAQRLLGSHSDLLNTIKPAKRHGVWKPQEQA